jgi:small subunit ribosomal protein S16
MSVKMRLARYGTLRKPTFRIVVMDSRAPTDGAYLESIGSYDPRTDPATVKVDEARVLYWLKNGVQPTETVRELLRNQGIWARFVAGKKEKSV